MNVSNSGVSAAFVRFGIVFMSICVVLIVAVVVVYVSLHTRTLTSIHNSQVLALAVIVLAATPSMPHKLPLCAFKDHSSAGGSGCVCVCVSKIGP